MAERSALFRALSASMSLAGSQTKGRVAVLIVSLGSASSFSSIYGRRSIFAENLQANFNTRTVLSGHYDCTNCGGSVSSLFGFLVIAFGVLIFGVYAVKQRRRSPVPPEEHEEEKVQVDEEGWETKSFRGDPQPDTDGSVDNEGWETKPES